MNDERVILMVQDNGVGFDLNGEYAGHFGLKTMRAQIPCVVHEA